MACDHLTRYLDVFFQTEQDFSEVPTRAGLSLRLAKRLAPDVCIAEEHEGRAPHNGFLIGLTSFAQTFTALRGVLFIDEPNESLFAGH